MVLYNELFRAVAKKGFCLKKLLRFLVGYSEQAVHSDFEEPYVDSESDYNPISSDTTSSSGSDEELCQNSSTSLISSMDKLKIENSLSLYKKTLKNYSINVDDYFTHQLTKKPTSNNTLGKLKTPRLSQDQLYQLLKNYKIPKSHRKCIADLQETNQSVYSKWLYLLNENFNILVYGIGSKREALELFHKTYLKSAPVIVVNGFFPSLSVKDITDAILDLLEIKKHPSNLHECCELIKQELANFGDIVNIYLIVHNIDGDVLRNQKSQNVLARLAAIDNIHLIASIDHINAPSMWDHLKLTKFNFTWWDLTSYQSYIEETSFESSLMVQKSAEFTLSSLRNVFLSLTTNSKGIYRIIMEHQLKKSKNQYYQGLPFRNLYSACREAFLVSSDLALRAQLTEFVDHKMLKFKRSVDGLEYLIIPISNVLLQKFLDEQTQ